MAFLESLLDQLLGPYLSVSYTIKAIFTTYRPFMVGWNSSGSWLENRFRLLLFPVFDCLVFHEHYVPTPHYFLFDKIPSSVAELILWVPHEYAWFHLVVEFRSLILSNMHIWQTSEHPQVLVGDIFSCPHFLWDITFQGHWGRPVNQIDSCHPSFNLIRFWKLCMWYHAPHFFHDRSLHPLRKPIQLKGLGHCILEFYALGIAILFELASVFATIVGPDSLQLSARLSFSSGLKFLKSQPDSTWSFDFSTKAHNFRL